MPGAREVARRLAEDLGWTLLDRELLHQAAAIEHVPDSELEALDEQSIGVADRFRLHPPHDRYIHGLKEVVEPGGGPGQRDPGRAGHESTGGQSRGCLPSATGRTPRRGGRDAWLNSKAGPRNRPWPAAPRWTGRGTASTATSSARRPRSRGIMTWWSTPGGFPSTTWSPASPRWCASSGHRARPSRRPSGGPSR